jgi:ribosome biogenesis GTPase
VNPAGGTPDATRAARVVSVGRNSAWIAFEGSDELQLASFPKRLERLSLVPGDLVHAAVLDAERVIVERREPRTFALERRTGGGRLKTMAANIDGIAIVAALAQPPLHPAMVDELLAFAAIHQITAHLILTKPDLAESEAADAIVTLYRSLGYLVLTANPKAREGVDAIEAVLRGHRTLLIGQSGVGKSSLFRAFGGSATVGDVSKGGRGRQTTSAGRLHHFDDGFVIDSPGVSEFELDGMTAADVANGFVEFVPLLGSCRFTDCSHRREPGCAIRAAVDAGRIARSRFESYIAIVSRRP